uniref:hypothetical protein n=1 Tax=uncultured Sphingomonas sp. TaxID=158754 RepID=UPI0035CC2854
MEFSALKPEFRPGIHRAGTQNETTKSRAFSANADNGSFQASRKSPYSNTIDALRDGTSFPEVWGGERDIGGGGGRVNAEALPIPPGAADSKGSPLQPWAPRILPLWRPA